MTFQISSSTTSPSSYLFPSSSQLVIFQVTVCLRFSVMEDESLLILTVLRRVSEMAGLKGDDTGEIGVFGFGIMKLDSPLESRLLRSDILRGAVGFLIGADDSMFEADLYWHLYGDVFLGLNFLGDTLFVLSVIGLLLFSLLSPEPTMSLKFPGLFKSHSSSSCWLLRCLLKSTCRFDQKSHLSHSNSFTTFLSPHSVICSLISTILNVLNWQSRHFGGFLSVVLVFAILKNTKTQCQSI